MDKWANWKTIDIEQSDIQQSLWTGSIIGNLVSRHLGKGLVQLLGDGLELLLLANQLVLQAVNLGQLSPFNVHMNNNYTGDHKEQGEGMP